MGVGCQHHAPAALPPGKETRYPSHRRLGGPQGRSGWAQKISPPPGFDLRTVQPIQHSTWYIIISQNGEYEGYRLARWICHTCRFSPIPLFLTIVVEFQFVKFWLCSYPSGDLDTCGELANCLFHQNVNVAEATIMKWEQQDTFYLQPQ
jgi:hypothetical protein